MELHSTPVRWLQAVGSVDANCHPNNNESTSANDNRPDGLQPPDRKNLSSRH
ncbi:hypothetical protein ABIB60_003413 [Hymenobacter sp. UYP22]